MQMCRLLFVCLLMHTSKPMESFATISQGCKPLEILSAFWNENRQLIYCTSAIFFGGCVVYDWYCKGQRIKQLEDGMHAVQADKTTTTILTEIRRVENRLELQERVVDTLEKDVTYLWRYIITDGVIHDHNKINREGKPYDPRPHVPWFNGKNIIDLIKTFATCEPQEFKGEPFHLIMPLPSPRRTNSPPRSGSPTNHSSPRNEENGNVKIIKKSGRKSPERKDKEKEKEKPKKDG